MACATLSAEVLFQETLQTRRGSTYIDQIQLTSYKAWPYASQWFTGYTGSQGEVEGNQFDNDYVEVKSYGVTVRGKKLNGEDTNTVGLFFSANKPNVISAFAGIRSKEQRAKTNMLRNLTILYMENLRIFIRPQDLRQMLPIGIGNKYLPKLIRLYHLYNPFHPLAIQSVKNIIQQ